MSFSNKLNIQQKVDELFPEGNLDAERFGQYSSYCLDLLSSPFIDANKLKKEKNRFEIFMDLHNFDKKKLLENNKIEMECLSYHKEGLDVMKKKFKTHAQPMVDHELKIDGTSEELKKSIDDFLQKENIDPLIFHTYVSNIFKYMRSSILMNKENSKDFISHCAEMLKVSVNNYDFLKEELRKKVEPESNTPTNTATTNTKTNNELNKLLSMKISKNQKLPARKLGGASGNNQALARTTPSSSNRNLARPGESSSRSGSRFRGLSMISRNSTNHEMVTQEQQERAVALRNQQEQHIQAQLEFINGVRMEFENIADTRDTAQDTEINREISEKVDDSFRRLVEDFTGDAKGSITKSVQNLTKEEAEIKARIENLDKSSWYEWLNVKTMAVGAFFYTMMAGIIYVLYTVYEKMQESAIGKMAGAAATALTWLGTATGLTHIYTFIALVCLLPILYYIGSSFMSGMRIIDTRKSDILAKNKAIKEKLNNLSNNLSDNINSKITSQAGRMMNDRVIDLMDDIRDNMRNENISGPQAELMMNKLLLKAINRNQALKYLYGHEEINVKQGDIIKDTDFEGQQKIMETELRAWATKFYLTIVRIEMQSPGLKIAINDVIIQELQIKQKETHSLTAPDEASLVFNLVVSHTDMLYLTVGMSEDEQMKRNALNLTLAGTGLSGATGTGYLTQLPIIGTALGALTWPAGAMAGVTGALLIHTNDEYGNSISGMNRLINQIYVNNYSTLNNHINQYVTELKRNLDIQMKAATANSDDFEFQQIFNSAIEAMKNHTSKNRIKDNSIITNIHLQFFTVAKINYELNNKFKTAIQNMRERQRVLEGRQSGVNAPGLQTSFVPRSLPSTQQQSIQQQRQPLSLTRGGNRKKSKKRKNKKNKNKRKNKNKNKSRSKKSKKKSNKKRKTHRK